MGKRAIPIAWTNGRGRIQVSVPAGPAQKDVAVAAMIRMAVAQGAVPTWVPEVEVAPSRLKDFVLYRESSGSPAKTCQHPFHEIEIQRKGRCEVCLAAKLT